MSDPPNGDASTKAERLAQEFRRRILSGEFTRDAWLRQDDLATEFNVSITPVREALRLLASEKLVVLQPHRGAQVVGADLDRIVAAYVVRRLVEAFAMRRAVYRLSRMDVDALTRMLDTPAAPDEDARTRNRLFHFYFYERCGLPELTATIAQMWDAFPWDLMLSTEERTRESEREHRLILDAAADGDAERAVVLLEAHLASGLRAIEEHLGSGDGVTDPFDAA